MRNVFMLLCFLIPFNLIFSQIAWYSSQSEIYPKEELGRNSILLNFCENKFVLNYEVFNRFITIDGKLSKSKDFYCCKVFFFQEILLKRIDKYRLLVLNDNLFFRKKIVLYTDGINDCNFKPIENCMLWDKGMRDGNWQCYTDKGIITTVWRKGRKMKQYFKTYEELEKVSSKLPQL